MPNQERGFVFITVLLAITVLTTLLSVFLYSIQVEHTSRKTAQNRIQAQLIAQAGSIAAEKLVRFSLQDQNNSSISSFINTPFTYATPEGTVTVRITDESALFPINSIVLPDGTVHPTYMPIAERLCTNLKIPLSYLEAISDWIDSDNQPRRGGAEAGWYQSQPQPHTPRNSLLRTTEELNLVKDSTSYLTTLKPYVTVYSEYGNNSSISLINLNTAPSAVLLALDQRMTEALVERILEYRHTTPFKTVAELAQVTGMSTIAPSVQALLSTSGSIFRITVKATVGKVIYTAESVVRFSGAKTGNVLYWREY